MSGSNERRSVSVRIAGHDYKIRSDGDESNLVRIAGYVDRAMQQVAQRTGTVDSLDVAVLTCLNLAREILALADQRSSGLPEEKLRGLIERVEAALPDSIRAERSDASAGESTGEAASESRPRTLELPSVEDRRDRLPAGLVGESTVDLDPVVPARAAAGGRERVG